MRRLLAGLAALGFVVPVACGDTGDGDSNLVAFGAPGCIDGNCSLCSSCVDECVCETGDVAGCEVACGATASSGGNTAAGGSTASGGQGGSGQGGSAQGGSGGNGQGGGGGVPAGLPAAAGLRITEISVWQGTKVPVMANGGDVGSNSRNAPVVAGRDALIRVYVSPDAEFQSREVIGRLELQGSQAGGPVDVRAFIGGNSADNDLNSSINFNVPGDQLTTDVSYSVSLLEVDAGASNAGSTDASRWPTSGVTSLQTESSGGNLQLVLVPLVVNGIAPDLSEGRVEEYRQRFRMLYPVPDIDVSVRQAVQYNGYPQPNGQGWNDALNFLLGVRQQDNPPSNAYYYGALTPESSAFSYCGGGCVAGLSPVGQVGSGGFDRGSIGLGFFQQNSLGATDTAVHEVGHAMGLGHAPCSTNDFEQSYPYNGGSIGNWGNDIATNELFSPQFSGSNNSVTDMMGYCRITHISDHNYRRMFNRIAYANGGGSYVNLPTDPARQPGMFRTAVIDEDGTLRWGETLPIHEHILIESTEITQVDEDGNAVGTLEGFYLPFSHLDGGLLYFRESLLFERPGAVELDVGHLGAKTRLNLIQQ